MKLKFLSLGLLALSFVACETYEESDSVAAMRNARTEYINAETGLKNAETILKEAEVAYKEMERARVAAEVKSLELQNAYLENANSIKIQQLQAELDEILLVLETAQMNLETAKLKFEKEKLSMEEAILAQTAAVKAENDMVLTKAYDAFTEAYAKWTGKTNILLDAQKVLADNKLAMMDLQYGFDHNNVQAKEEATLAGLVVGLAEQEASLVSLNEILSSNEWDALIADRDAKVAKKNELLAEQSFVSDEAHVAAKKVFDAAGVALEDAVKALQAWGDKYKTSKVIVDGKGILVWAASFDAERDRLKNLRDGAKLVVDAAEEAYENDNSSANQEAIDIAQGEYDETIAAYNAYTYEVIKAELAALNASYVAAFENVPVKEKIYTDLLKEYNDAIAVFTNQITALNEVIARLNSLVFVYKTKTTTLEELDTAMIDELKGEIEDIETAIADVEESILVQERLVAKIEAGNYDQATAVEDQNLVIAKQEVIVAEAQVLADEAKVLLDIKQAEYKALLN